MEGFRAVDRKSVQTLSCASHQEFLSLLTSLFLFQQILRRRHFSVFRSSGAVLQAIWEKELSWCSTRSGMLIGCPGLLLFMVEQMSFVEGLRQRSVPKFQNILKSFDGFDSGAVARDVLSSRRAIIVFSSLSLSPIPNYIQLFIVKEKLLITKKLVLPKSEIFTHTIQKIQIL